VPIRWFDLGAYFEVEIRAVRDDQDDGIVVGVTTSLPEASNEPVDVAADVPSSWSMGYDGNAHIDGKKKMIPIAWSGIKLRVRDRVGFLVTRQGDAWIVENGVPKTSLPERVPYGRGTVCSRRPFGARTRRENLPGCVASKGASCTCVGYICLR